MDSCRLCNKDNSVLKNSHIVPKLFFNYIKKESLTAGLRTVANPNKREQDGLKTEFLCGDCETKFSRYETAFANKVYNPMKENKEKFCFDTNDDEIAYFVLSIGWRVLQYHWETDKTMIDCFTSGEQMDFENVLEEWRNALYYEQFEKIRSIQMHIIPTEKLDVYQKQSVGNLGHVGMDFKAMGEMNKIYWSYVFVKVPHLIFLCTSTGSSPAKLKQYLVGKFIETKKSSLPKDLLSLISKHFDDFKDSTTKLSASQRDSIAEKAAKRLSTKHVSRKNGTNS